MNTIFVTRATDGSFSISPETITLKSSCNWTATNLTSQYLNFTNTDGAGGISYLPIGLTPAFFAAFAGGIAGNNYTSTILNVYATGNVTAQESSPADVYAGGLVAYFYRGSLQNAYTTGEVKGTGVGGTSLYVRVGGIVGHLSGYSTSSYVSYLQNCVALNSSVSRICSNTASSAGRIWCYSYGYIEKANNYAHNMTLNGGTIGSGTAVHDGKNGALCEAMPTEAWWLTTAWDFTSVWTMGANGYPKLQGPVF